MPDPRRAPSRARRHAAAAAPGAPRARAARATPTSAEETCASGPSPARGEMPRRALGLARLAPGPRERLVSEPALRRRGDLERGGLRERMRESRPPGLQVRQPAVDRRLDRALGDPELGQRPVHRPAPAPARRRSNTTSAYRACAESLRTSRANASCTLAGARNRSVSGAAPARCSGESSRAASRSHNGCPPPAAASSARHRRLDRGARELVDQPHGLRGVQAPTINDSKPAPSNGAADSVRAANRKPTRSA